MISKNIYYFFFPLSFTGDPSERTPTPSTTGSAADFNTLNSHSGGLPYWNVVGVKFDEHAHYVFTNNPQMVGKRQAVELAGNFFHLLRCRRHPQENNAGGCVDGQAAMSLFNRHVVNDVETILKYEYFRTKDEDIFQHFEKIGKLKVVENSNLCLSS